jgi:peptidoglycan/LPS O-acetylase OafA/YrhL
LTATSPNHLAGRGRLVHIRELDGVRGIAAIMVFFHHLFYTDLNPVQWGPAVKALYYVSAVGDRGVDLFFVLSGFLITSLLIKDRESPAFYRDFYWKRALRILPLYLLCLIGVALFIPHSGKQVMLSAFFIINFAQIFHIESIGPFWTLAIEEQFYILWPTVVRRRSVELLTRWAILIGLGAFVLRFIAACVGHYNYRFTFLRCDGLAAGALLACWFERRQDTPEQRRTERKIMAIAAILGLVCLLARPLMPPTHRGMAFDADLYQTGPTLLATSAIAFIIANTGSRLLAVLRSRVLLFFGLISYAMYMTHLYVALVYNTLRGPLPQGDTTALTIRFFSVLSITIALCLLTRYLIELPATSLRRFVLKMPAPPAEIEEPLLAD